jgi:hypothetical protein
VTKSPYELNWTSYEKGVGSYRDQPLSFSWKCQLCWHNVVFPQHPEIFQSVILKSRINIDHSQVQWLYLVIIVGHNIIKTIITMWLDFVSTFGIVLGIHFTFCKFDRKNPKTIQALETTCSNKTYWKPYIRSTEIKIKLDHLKHYG